MSTITLPVAELLSESVISPPFASSTISPATSTVRSPVPKAISVPSMIILSITTPALAVTLPVAATVPATVTFAPLKVIAVALLDLISLPVTVKSPLNTVNGDVTRTSPSVAFVIVSLLLSIKPFACVISTPALAVINPAAVTAPLKDAAPAADISMVNAVIVLPPSFPLKIISLS